MAHSDTRNGKALPDGWAWTTMEEACEIVLGQSPPSSTYNTDGIGLPFYQGKTEFGDLYPTPVKWCSEPKKIAKSGDVLISVRAPVGPTNLCREKSCIGRGLSAVRPEADMQSLYFLYFLRHIEQEWDSKATGTTFKAITGKVLRTQEVLLAPLSEQHRIVAQIETQFTRVEAGVAALKGAQAKLRRYKASVLKAACEGRLVPTEAELARAEGRDYERAEVLLQRVLAERHAKWEEMRWAKEIEKAKKKAAQATRRAAGLSARIRDLADDEWQDMPDEVYARYLPKNDRWKEKYKEPAPPDTSELPELPKGWVWATVEQLASPEPRSIQSGPFGSALLHSEFQGTGILAVGIDNVLVGQFSMGKQHRISPEKFEQLRKFAARPLDFLITVMATVGRCCVVPPNLETAIITKHVYRVSVNHSFISPYYLMYAFWGGSEVHRQLFGEVRGQTRPGINGTILRKIAVPIPPLPEQQHIIAEVERRLSVAEELEKQVEAALLRAGRLRQAILKHAFEGKLVPQDPDDEPASVLLERTQTARAEQRAGRKKSRKPRQIRMRGMLRQDP